MPPETPDLETSSADYARRFQGAAGRYLLRTQARCIARALAGVPPGSVLDVGGGHGQLLEPLRALGWQVTVHGTTSECEANLRARHPLGCPFLQGPLHPLPATDRSFDLVIAVRLLSHVSNWPQLISEMCRVSKRAVIFDYPSKGGLNGLTPLLFGLKKSLEGNTRTYRSFSREELRRVLLSQGFRIEREVKQFFLPMVLHRVGQAAFPLRAAERLSRLVGITGLAGSPVILRAERIAQDS
jgi:ubiquinone/menaquinone biosynthesis C-methylase UbiE